MNNPFFVRKLFYVAAMALLLIPLYLLGQPSTRKADGQIGGGGQLSELRDRYEIGQADIGQIDPASESMRLATLGMRGIAAAWLWQKAEYYKEEKFYDRLAATLNQIALLQPHFVKVWESQAHNLAYNVSHDFDDYRQRYAWVKKGIDFLVKGTEYNQRQPILQWHLGKYTTQKIGRSDEKLQFRELFRNDTDYHNELIADGLTNLPSEALGPDRKPDNWLVGRLWFLKAYDLVDAGAIINKNEVHFYGEAPWTQMYFAEAIESDGVLDDRARFAWSRASESWREFGNRDILTTWGDSVKLNNFDRLNSLRVESITEFEQLTTKARERLLQEYKPSMNESELYVIEKPDSELDAEQRIFKQTTLDKYLSNRFEIARMLPTDERLKALTLATLIRETEETIKHTDQYRNLCNFAYWEMRAKAEQSPVTLAARRQMYEADKLIDRADLSAATKYYEKAWLNWNAVFHRYPEMMLEEIADEVRNAIKRYGIATDTEFDESFALYEFENFRNIRDGNRADEMNNRRFMQMLLDAPQWESAMNEPALLDNDVIPLPEGMDPKPSKVTKEASGLIPVKPEAQPSSNDSLTTKAEIQSSSENTLGDDQPMNNLEVTADGPATVGRPPSLQPPTDE